MSFRKGAPDDSSLRRVWIMPCMNARAVAAALSRLRNLGTNRRHQSAGRIADEVYHVLLDRKPVCPFGQDQAKEMVVGQNREGLAKGHLAGCLAFVVIPGDRLPKPDARDEHEGELRKRG